jgi:hypothetical protein
MCPAGAIVVASLVLEILTGRLALGQGLPPDTVVAPTPGTAPVASRDSLREFRVRMTDPIEARILRLALIGAAQRLEESQCRTVLSEFRDPQGHPLANALTKLETEAARYLTWLHFRDAPRQYCDGSRLAVTAPRSRAVFVCGRSFERSWRENAVYAEATLIHEMLHSLGLDENPPSSGEITARIRLRCGVRVVSAQTERPSDVDATVVSTLATVAIDLLRPEQRPTLPIVVIDPARVSKVVAKLAEGRCGFVVLPDPAVIYINAKCPFVREALQPSPSPVAIAAVAALVAHEQRHVLGDSECGARRVELDTFRGLVLRMRRERDRGAIRHTIELARRVGELQCAANPAGSTAPR